VDGLVIMALNLAASIQVRRNPTGWGPGSDLPASIQLVRALGEGQSRFIDFSSSKLAEEEDEYTTVEGKIQSKSKYLSRRGLVPLKSIRGKVAQTFTNRPNAQLQKTLVKKIYREPSIQIRGEWVLVTELGKQQFDKLTFDPGEVTDLRKLTKVHTYNSAWDSIQVKKPIALDTANVPVVPSNTSSTSEDAVMKELMASENSGVFITDIILATLMTSLRAIHPWDILITKDGEKIVFDKQPNSTLEMITVNENAAPEGLPEEEEREDSINGQRELAKEALRVNRSFRSRAATGDLCPEGVEMHPDDLQAESDRNCAYIGYKYRKWNLPGGAGNPPLPVIVRTEYDAYVRTNDEFVLLRAVNEYDGRITGSYRQKLENNRGQLLSTEAKNNACKLSKWALQAQLAGINSIRLGFVSRLEPRVNTKHVLLGILPCLTTSFIGQLNLNYANCWGVFRYIVELIRSQPNGRYYLLKDPNKQMVRLYRVPAESQPEQAVF